MEGEDLGAWLGLGIGGGGEGCVPRRSHNNGERWSDVQKLPHQSSDDKEEMRVVRGRDQNGHDAAVVVSKNTDNIIKGARKRLKKAIDASSEGADDGGSGGARKKLRLTEEQSTLLEGTFRSHNILSHAQKHELARQVNLTPRQVEVWFQNRRARTKLKQTEVDCEFLKRCCKSLTVENQRLKHELVELQRSAAAAAGLYVRAAAAAADTASLCCPSCDKVTLTIGGETSNKSSSSYSS